MASTLRIPRCTVFPHRNDFIAQGTDFRNSGTDNLTHADNLDPDCRPMGIGQRARQ